MNDSYWAKAVTPRQQTWFCPPTLDDRIEPDAEIRPFEAILLKLDWTVWEGKVRRERGQPPTHPRLVAGTILYCTLHGAHSSRRQEKATRNWQDLNWFLEGRTLDHSTLCHFRKAFGPELAELFSQTAREAAKGRAAAPAKEAGAGDKAGRTVAVDGTRIRANSDRHGARTAGSLAKRLEQVAEQREALLAKMDRVDAGQRLGEPIVAALADGGFASGANLQHFEQPGAATLYTPVAGTVQPIVAREDASQPVACGHWEELAMSGAGASARLARETFVYVKEQDAYYCPNGRPLRRVGQEQRRSKNGQTHIRARYQSADCSNCPLARRCVSGARKTRSITRDESEPSRERVAARMSSTQAKAMYAKRAPVVEGVFGYIKYAMGVRRFLTRGSQNVSYEWNWICTAFNLGKILRAAGRLHRQSAGQLRPAGAGTARQGGPKRNEREQNAAVGPRSALGGLETAWLVCATLIRHLIPGPCRAAV